MPAMSTNLPLWAGYADVLQGPLTATQETDQRIHFELEDLGS